jgi:hypothetical protein
MGISTFEFVENIKYNKRIAEPSFMKHSDFKSFADQIDNEQSGEYIIAKSS